jgi:hypothetical protein
MGGQWFSIDPPSAGSCLRLRLGQHSQKLKQLSGGQEFPEFKGPNHFLQDIVHLTDWKQSNEGNHPRRLGIKSRSLTLQHGVNRRSRDFSLLTTVHSHFRPETSAVSAQPGVGGR